MLRNTYKHFFIILYHNAPTYEDTTRFVFYDNLFKKINIFPNTFLIYWEMGGNQPTSGDFSTGTKMSPAMGVMVVTANFL